MVFSVQWSQPNKNDWTVLVRQDLSDFDIEENLSTIKGKSEWSFKNLVRIKAHEYEFNNLLDIKQLHSKMNNLEYSKF